jgi:hypothetical protein
MPRPKSEITDSSKMVGIRLTEWQLIEFKKLGGQKWLREYLLASKRLRDKQ